MIHKNISISNQESETIRAEIHYHEGAINKPCIIVCHGFKGFKNWAFFPLLAESLACAGYVAVTFNFSRNGIGADLQNFTELELFKKNTCSLELLDLKAVVDAISSGQIGKGLINSERIGLVGHSRGGGISLLYTHSDPRIKSLVTWSAISTVHRYTDEIKTQWIRDGYIEIENKRTMQTMQVGIELLNDLEKNKTKLDILTTVEDLNIPTMIIHGEADETVPVEEARLIYDHLGSPEKELIIIEGGTHTYGAQHPMSSTSEQLKSVFDLTENWFDRFLK